MLFDADISSLSDLIEPMSPQEFLDYYVKQVPVFVHGGHPRRAKALINAHELSDIVHQGLHPDGRIGMFQNGKPIPSQCYSTLDTRPRTDPAAVRRLLSGGASLVLNGLDELHPKIGDLCHALELEFASNVWANAYVTVNEFRAFDTHFDDHDVIVLQISGVKRWKLFGKTEEFPLHPRGALPQSPSEEIQTDIVSPGEVLFIPRGVWHRAEAVSTPAFHITFGVGGVTGIDLVQGSIDELSREPIFRKYLPRIGSAQALRDHEEKLKSYLHRWVDRLSGEVLLASIDLARGNRSRVILWDQVRINCGTKLWIASRRMLPIEFLEGSDGRSIRMPRTSREFSRMSLLVLKIAFSRMVLSFEELLTEVRAVENTSAEADVVEAVRELVEHGLLNVEGA
jgi:hypothetical protein